MRGTAGRRPPSRSSWISRTRRPPPPPAPHGQGRNHQGCSSIPLPGNSMNKTVTHEGPHQRASAPTPLLATCLSLWRHGWVLLPPARLPARACWLRAQAGGSHGLPEFPPPRPTQSRWRFGASSQPGSTLVAETSEGLCETGSRPTGSLVLCSSRPSDPGSPCPLRVTPLP